MAKTKAKKGDASTKKKTKKTTSKTEKSPKKKTKKAKVVAYTPTTKEIENGRKVLAILEDIEDIGYTIHRPDLFTVEEPELGLQISVDAEESVICLLAEICAAEHLAQNIEDWPIKLLELNNQLLHGAFSLKDNKIWLRENLASENLDANELEDALGAMFAGIIRYARVLKLG